MHRKSFEHGGINLFACKNYKFEKQLQIDAQENFL